MSEDLVGQRVREYDVLEELGRSEASTLYRARHVLLDEERALKVYASSGDQQLNGREAKALNRLQHENVVRFHEYWEQDGVAYLALELLSGHSLRARLREHGRLPWEEAVEIARQAALGLQAVHARGLIHRGISPDNLHLVPLEAGGFVVKVLDFSISRRAQEASLQGTRSVVRGLEYASPEQCGYGLPPGEALDVRADVYGLGVVLYEMLTGEVPVRAGTLVGFREMHTHATPSPPSQHLLPGTLPPWLDALVVRMLSKQREARPASMEEVLLGLRGPVVVAEASQRRKRGDLEEGSLFAQRYRIQGRLGAGGMGVVYRALDTLVDQPLALKVISAAVAEDRDGLERLKREVVLARRIAHPNACRTYDIGEYEGTAYVTMELIEGESLGKRLRQTPRLSAVEALEVARDVLQALVVAHGLGIVHRDLKPDNIMVGDDGRVALMDFGLSVSSDTRRVTRIGMVVGTPAYMTPEQIVGRDVDRRSDLYSLGVILFQLTTGSLPFPRSDAMAVMAAHVRDPVPHPSEVWPEVPPAVDALIVKAMAKQREERFQSADEFLAAVQALIANPHPENSSERGAGGLGFVFRRLDGALRALGLRGGKQTHEARMLVEQAQSRLASGDREGAIALLERTGTEHPLIEDALTELRRRP